MKTTYHINPRIKKHWFKQNTVVYDLIKYSEEDYGKTVSLGKLSVEFFPQKTEKVIFSSPNIEQAIIIKNNLER